jgi:hypothetical protein
MKAESRHPCGGGRSGRVTKERHQRSWTVAANTFSRNTQNMNQYSTNAKAAESTMRSLFPPTPIQRNDHLSARAIMRRALHMSVAISVLKVLFLCR